MPILRKLLKYVFFCICFRDIVEGIVVSIRVQVKGIDVSLPVVRGLPPRPGDGGLGVTCR